MDNNIGDFLRHEKDKQINRISDWNNKHPPDEEVMVSRNGYEIVIGVWHCPKDKMFLLGKKEYSKYNPYKLHTFEYSILNTMLDIMFKESKK